MTDRDWPTVAGAVALVTAAAVVAPILGSHGHLVHASAAPWFAHVAPHVGPGTPIAVAVALAVVRWGPTVAASLKWRRALTLGFVTAYAWILGLALVDGWQRGVAGRLTTMPEYLSEVPGVDSIKEMLAQFSSRIVDGPNAWHTHVSGHPPGALLSFVVLDRIGLGGGAAAALVCIAGGALAAVAVPVTVRALGSETAARRVLPFAVLLPGAVWLGVSADALFAGVTAAGIACLAMGLTASRILSGLAWCLAAGLALAFGCYLSYGLVLMVLPVTAVIVLAHRSWWRLLAMAGATLTVIVAFTAAGFWWYDGYHLVKVRYYQGLASQRPYWYWVWANIAALVGAIGLAGAAIAVRAVRGVRLWRSPAVLLPVAALAAMAIADLTGLSKGEVERIWLPFAVWIPAGAALLPAGTDRSWLTAQAAVALLLNHVLLTVW